MQSPNSGSPIWSPLEIRLLNTVDVFLHKPAIIKKAETNLTQLKQVLVADLAQSTHPCPPTADILKGQIARGENNKGFPFISLDMPQMFSKTEMFTYRTLFWWGHDLIFSLIIKQTNHSALINRLIQLKNNPKWNDIKLATSPTPWEWENNSDNFITTKDASENDIRKAIESNKFIKLCRFFPLNNPSFSKLNWVDSGLMTWKTLSDICAD